jgi:hypothetical protein
MQRVKGGLASVRFFDAPIRWRVIYAMAAALSWWGMAELDQELRYPDWGPLFYATGGVFSALVLVPYLPNLQGVLKVRALALFACGVLSYWSAVETAVGLAVLPNDISGISVVIAGIAGAVIVGIGARLAVPHVLRWSGWLMLAMAGCIGGVVVMFGLDEGFRHYPSRVDYVYLLPGHVAWEVLVCLALYYGSERARRRFGGGRSLRERPDRTVLVRGIQRRRSRRQSRRHPLMPIVAMSGLVCGPPHASAARGRDVAFGRCGMVTIHT